MTFLLIPPYLIFAFFVLRAVLKKQNTRKRKWQMGLLTAFLLYLPFGWDVILGRVVFYGLCATQGGVHVYQAVELGSEYWNGDGSPKFIDSKGNLDNLLLENKYINVDEYSENYFKIFSISKTDRKIIFKSTGKTISRHTSYIYFGGWFSKYTGFHVSGDGCHTARGFYQKFLQKTFVPAY